jgi:hypothetical protein
MIDGTVAKHFKILGGMLVSRFYIIERVEHACSLYGALLNTIYHFWRGYFTRFKYRGGNINSMGKLASDFVFGYIFFWCLVGCMGGPCGKISKEGLIGR